MSSKIMSRREKLKSKDSLQQLKVNKSTKNIQIIMSKRQDKSNNKLMFKPSKPFYKQINRRILNLQSSNQPKLTNKLKRLLYVNHLKQISMQSFLKYIRTRSHQIYNSPAKVFRNQEDKSHLLFT